MRIYYTYIYHCPSTKEPFYVGIGKGRRYADHLKEAIARPIPVKGEHKLNKIREILREGSEPLIEFVGKNLSREEAIELEIELIKRYGRRDLGTGILTNQTNGGDGYRGWSEEQKQRCRERNLELGIVPPSQKGRKQNRRPEFKAIPAVLVSTGERIKISPEDPRWKTGEIVGINKGSRHSESQRKKLSESMSKLKWWNDGVKCVRSIESPGPDFILGRGKVKW